MALLDFTKKKKKTETLPKKVKVVEQPKQKIERKNIAAGSETSSAQEKNIGKGKEKGEKYAPIILHPIITEKAAHLTSQNAYTFAVRKDANKQEVAKAMVEMYGVSPIRVNMMHVPARRIRVRGHKGMRTRHNKAIVFLKEGDRIEFI